MRDKNIEKETYRSSNSLKRFDFCSNSFSSVFTSAFCFSISSIAASSFLSSSSILQNEQIIKYAFNSENHSTMQLMLRLIMRNDHLLVSWFKIHSLSVVHCGLT